jgi:hypothetical protein
MNIRAYSKISGTIFTLVSLAHLMRLFYGWPAEVDGLAVPMFASWMGFLVPGGLAIWGFRASR